MNYYQCPKCKQGVMIRIDSSIAWGRLELYFCTQCHHTRWLGSNRDEYIKVPKTGDIIIDGVTQEAIERVLKTQRYQSTLFLVAITLCAIVIIVLIEG